MDLKELKEGSTPFKPYNVVMLLVVAFLVVTSYIGTGMSFKELIDGYSNMVSYLTGDPTIEHSSYFDVNLDKTNLIDYSLSIVETVAMAIVAMFLALLISFPISMLSSLNVLDIIFPSKSILSKMVKNSLYTVSILIANAFRSINEIIWALIFVSAVGLGPMSGVLALAIHTAGVLTKLLAEGYDGISKEPIKAVSATGASSLKVIRFAVIPQIMPHLISMSLYRFESAIRSASVLGFVGAGGIGFYLFDKIRSFENSSVTTILIMIIATVYVVDKISAYLRKRFI